MSNTEILDDLDEIVATGRRWGDVIKAQRDENGRLKALVRDLEAANRQLLNTNLRLKAEVDATGQAIEAAREYADSMI